MITLFVLGLLLAVNLNPSEANVGICYKPGPNQPPPAEVVALLEKYKIDRMRLFQPNKEILTALKGKNIEVMLVVPNYNVVPFAADPALAEAWVSENVKPYLPDVKIKYLDVGTNIDPNNDNNGLSFFLFNTLQNFQKALYKAGLKDIKATSSFDNSVLFDKTLFLGNESFLPQSLEFFEPILKQLSSDGAPFLINIYPYYDYIMSQQKLSLDWVLFKFDKSNLFDLMIDSMYMALEKAGYSSLEIIVAETGWPSAGGLAASVENQKTYVTNLVKHANKGTPKRPNKPIEAYVYSMFDEIVYFAPEIEKHFGLFTLTKESKFDLKGTLNQA